MVMIWDGEGITVQPDEPTEEDTAGEHDYMAFEDGTFALERPAALEEKPAVEWLFWRSGTCEPAIIHFDGGLGKWTARYDALTTRAEIIDKEVR